MDRKEKPVKIKTEAQRLRSTESALARARIDLKREQSRLTSLRKDSEKQRQEYEHIFARYHEILQELRSKEKANADLVLQLDAAKKQISWYEKQYFGQKSEANIVLDVEYDAVPEEPEPSSTSKRKRGQQVGSVGHGRTDRSNLPESDPEIIELADPSCPDCHLPYSVFPKTEDSSIVEIETEIFRRIIKRTCYTASCKCAPKRIITASAPQSCFRKQALETRFGLIYLCKKCRTARQPIAF